MPDHFYEKIYILSLVELQEHVKKCRSCQQIVSAEFKLYKQCCSDPNDPAFKGFRAGISTKEEFISASWFARRHRVELLDYHWDQITEKMSGDELPNLLQGLIYDQTFTMRCLRHSLSPKIHFRPGTYLITQGVKSIKKRFEKIASILGLEAFEVYFGASPEEIIESWESFEAFVIKHISS